MSGTLQSQVNFRGPINVCVSEFPVIISTNTLKAICTTTTTAFGCNATSLEDRAMVRKVFTVKKRDNSSKNTMAHTKFSFVYIWTRNDSLVEPD